MAGNILPHEGDLHELIIFNNYITIEFKGVGVNLHWSIHRAIAWRANQPTAIASTSSKRLHQLSADCPWAQKWSSLVWQQGESQAVQRF
ncbi:hypothetical protein [Gloeothece verrucosa]|uniref:hypothetical protein n=1 Tax=Gloeothece verrucosa TaxID=2546359 RepID=UPI0012FF0E79|nr:hypothetical protein [Gloeothece verrucosa]